MKKIYLGALALSIGSLSFGQQLVKQNFGQAHLELNDVSNSPLSTIKDVNPIDKSAGDTIWSEDFTAGIPVGWTLVDNTGQGFDWVLDPGTANIVADFTDTPPIASTSGGNSMLLFGDSYNSPTPAGGAVDMDAYFQTSAIPINGEPSINLVFQQKFRLCCSGSASLDLMVSTDPTFPIGPNTLTVDVSGTTATNDQLALEVKTVNISSIAGGLVGNIYLRFHGSPGSSHYYWFVDDIQLVESPNNAITGNDFYAGFEYFDYSRIPVSQAIPADFSVFAQNDGGTIQPNTVLTVYDNGVVASTGTPTDLAFLANDSITAPSYTPPTTIAVPHVFTLTISSDSSAVEDDISDNTADFAAFEYTDYIYAYDDYGTPGAGGGGNGTAPNEDFAFEAGNAFDIWVAADLGAIDVVIGAGTPVGTNFKAVLYERTASAPFYSKITETAYIPSTTAMINNVTTMLLPAWVTLNPNTTYFAAVSCLTEFYYGTSGNSSSGAGTGSQTSLIYYGTMDAPITGKNFYTANTPMVRMNFDPALPIGINEVNNTTNLDIFPNPSNGVFNINISSKESNNVNLTVKNTVGQTILTKTVKVSGTTNHQISLADYSKGIYFLTVGNKTVKLIVE